MTFATENGRALSALSAHADKVVSHVWTCYIAECRLVLSTSPSSGAPLLSAEFLAVRSPRGCFSCARCGDVAPLSRAWVPPSADRLACSACANGATRDTNDERTPNPQRSEGALLPLLLPPPERLELRLPWSSTAPVDATPLDATQLAREVQMWATARRLSSFEMDASLLAALSGTRALGHSDFNNPRRKNAVV
jgi:hypothetical protein